MYPSPLETIDLATVRGGASTRECTPAPAEAARPPAEVERKQELPPVMDIAPLLRRHWRRHR